MGYGRVMILFVDRGGFRRNTVFSSSRTQGSKFILPRNGIFRTSPRKAESGARAGVGHKTHSLPRRGIVFGQTDHVETRSHISSTSLRQTHRLARALCRIEASEEMIGKTLTEHDIWPPPLTLEQTDDNPLPWLPEPAWQAVASLGELEEFAKFGSDLVEAGPRFREWFNHITPETEKLPLDWYACPFVRASSRPSFE